MNKFSIKGWSLVLVGGFAIIIVYFLLRLMNLTVFPIFADEAIYIRWAQVMRAEPTLRFLPLSDGKQPLFMWLVMPLLSFFQDPLVAGRMLSVASGFGTMIGIFLLSFFLFKSKLISLLAGLLYAVVPFAVFFDRMALVDSLLSMFGVWILFLGLLLQRYRRADLAIITGLVLGAAMITKSPATFFVLLLPTTILFLVIDYKKKGAIFREEGSCYAGRIIKLVGLWLIVYLFAFGIYNLLRLGPGFETIGSRNQDYLFTFGEVLSHPNDPFRPHIGQVWEWFRFYLGIPLLLTFVGGLLIGLRKFPRQAVILALWFFVPLLTQMAIAKVFTARYVFFVIPYLLLLSASFISWLLRRINGTKTLGSVVKYVTIPLVLVIIFVPLLSSDLKLLTNPKGSSLPSDERRGYLEEWSSGYGISEVRDYLKSLPVDKQIIVGTEGYFGTLPDGLFIYFDKDRRFTILGVGLSLDKIPNQLADSAKKGNPTYLVVNKSRMRAQSDSGLELVLEVPKAKGEKGQDSLLLYKVK